VSTYLGPLRERMVDLAARLERADAFFAKNGPEHRQYQEAAKRADAIAKEIDEVTGALWSLGYTWNGSQVVMRDDDDPTPNFTPPPTPAEPGVFAAGWTPKGETGTGSVVAEWTGEED